MSVKEGIDPDKFHRKLEGISTAIAWMRYLGPDCWLFKVDIRSAYRHCSIRLLDQLFHVFCWHNEYYVDHNLSFGFCTAPAIWNRFANLICWIANQRLDPSTAKIAHYVDKFYGIVRGSQVVADSVFFGFLTLLSFLGVLILDEKLIHPTKAMTLVGFNLNSTSIFVKIPPEHIASFVNELEAWLGKDRCFLNELQSLVGWMIWCGQVIPHACTFTQHSISHLHPTRKGGCIWHVSLEMKQEFLWWICAVQYWPGLDIFADRLWYEPSLSHFYTDLTLWAGGATFLDYLTFIPWPLHLGTSIQALELATILVALYTFAPMMKGSRLICFTDNNANVKALEKGASENTVVHAIIQEIYWAHLQLQTQVRLVFIPGRTNIIADKISRCTSAAEAALAFPHLQFLEPSRPQISVTNIYSAAFLLLTLHFALHSSSMAAEERSISVHNILSRFDIGCLIAECHLHSIPHVPCSTIVSARLTSLLWRDMQSLTHVKYLSALLSYKAVVNQEGLGPTNLMLPLPCEGLWSFISSYSCTHDFPALLQALSGLAFWCKGIWNSLAWAGVYCYSPLACSCSGRTMKEAISTGPSNFFHFFARHQGLYISEQPFSCPVLDNLHHGLSWAFSFGRIDNHKCKMWPQSHCPLSLSSNRTAEWWLKIPECFNSLCKTQQPNDSLNCHPSHNGWQHMPSLSLEKLCSSCSTPWAICFNKFCWSVTNSWLVLAQPFCVSAWVGPHRAQFQVRWCNVFDWTRHSTSHHAAQGLLDRWLMAALPT